jgi:uncharacterized protein DUF3105
MRARFGFFLAISCTPLVLACGGDDDPKPPPTPQGFCKSATAALIAAAGDPETPIDPIAEEPVPDSACNAVVRTYPPPTDAAHVQTCSAVSYGTNPPVSGRHYPLFPEFRVYDYAIPRGFYVHSLEHGGVVITYSCTHCADEVASARELVETLEIDPLCCAGGSCGDATNRMTLTPDPGIRTAWAASAWGSALTADCFEPEVFKAFAETYRGTGPEQICANTYAVDVSRAPSSD